ncbi:MAG: very short patch repair endonuclease [Eggerthellaceae bacterium]|uniref:Very short patch repair endonuclease n=1 Tax=Denitrobacterium detoxificans TaxID=79604 RepID=A0A1H8Q9M5_9ACTN|nr:very short patch repair endonuclease [Denitrobacterium detoxificans]MCR5582365.1 very short patch repair endonuclease [Eggerthellaceae bacterium]SEO50952.1 T/G mismatch-specific endonuclease [Denitrobacterium detoxificans]
MARMVSEAVHNVMVANKRVNTKPELLVRRMLREMGWSGYRCDWKKCVGHPDIAYPGRKIAIFVHGCFWHHHEGCKHATTPKSNLDYWNAKFTRNRERDERVRAQLEEEGWHVVVIWECELKKDKLEETKQALHDEIEYAFVTLDDANQPEEQPQE